MKVSRNEPCPCGSGKKYKRCCLLKGGVRSPQSRILGIVMLLVTVAVTLTVGLTLGWKNGALAGVCALTLAGILYAIGNRPPPGKGRSDPGSINFGR